MEPNVIVIVLNWNNAPDTIACLDSLSRMEYRNRQIIVVDNGSTDASLSLLQEAYPGIGLLRTEENLGYAEGNNVGIRHALVSRPDYVCLLNNDVEVTPEFLNTLVREAESEASIGIVGPKMYFFEPADMVFAAGSLVEWNRGAFKQRGIWQRENAVGALYGDNPEDVDFIIGCGVLIKREVLEKIGLLDPRYYLNIEDVDLCIRAREAGYRVRYTPHAILRHKVSATLGQASPRNTYYMTRNALLFFASHLNGWRRWRTVARIVVRNLGHIAVWTIKPQYRHSARARRDANTLALRDALLGRYGKMGPDVEAVCR